MFYPKSKPSKPILQFDKDMNLIKEWTSLMEAARSLGLQESNISRVAHGDKRRKTCGGFIWMYKTI